MHSHDAPNFVRLTVDESAQFDSFRGLAAWIVAIAHANQIIIAPTFPGAASALGLLAQAAVMIFFVLSGFLISKSVRGNEIRHDGKFSAAKYAMDRVLRIWPPLLFSIALVALLFWLAPMCFPSGTNAFIPTDQYALARPGLAFEPIAYLGAAAGLTDFFVSTPVPSSNGPLWSLSIEIWYYLLAAVLAWPRGGWKILSVAGAIGLCYIGWDNDQFFYYLPVWWSGYLLSRLHDRRWIPGKHWLNGALVLCFAAAVFFGLKSVSTQGRESWHFLVMFNVSTGFAFTCALARILKGHPTIPPRFERAAAYSYTLYVIHVPIFLFVFGIAQTRVLGSVSASVALALIGIAITYAIAKLSAGVLENKKRLRSIYKHRWNRAI